MFSEQAYKLQNSIFELRQSSSDFMNDYISDRKSAAEQSLIGLRSLDIIVQYLLMYRDEAKLNHDSKFKKNSVGKLYDQNIDYNIKKSVMQCHDEALNGLESKTPSLSVLLNKIKHREEKLCTFSIVNDEHVLYLSGKKFQNQGAYILRFKVDEFCAYCEDYIPYLDNYYKDRGLAG